MSRTLIATPDPDDDRSPWPPIAPANRLPTAPAMPPSLPRPGLVDVSQLVMVLQGTLVRAMDAQTALLREFVDVMREMNQRSARRDRRR